MAKEPETLTDDQDIDGVRGISPIADVKGTSGNTEIAKKIGVIAGFLFLGLLAYLQWPSQEEAPVEEVSTSTRQIRSGGQFQPADIIEQDQAHAVAAVEPETPSEPLGPIERIRIEQDQLPAEPSEAELLFESSKRAPLMAYEGTVRSGSAAGSAETEGGSLFGTPDNGSGQGPSRLAASLQGTGRDTVFASVLENPHLTITRGTIIPCALDTAMNSSQPGDVRCTITDDVRSTTGTVILLEKGTTVVGEYRGGLQRGQKRLFVVWSRAETPNAVTVNLDSSGTDALGRAGFDGDIDTQFWTRFGGTIMLSVIDDALAAAVVSASNADTIENTTNGVSSLAQTELQSTINVPVVLTKNQGEEVAIMMARDLDFSSVYRLKPR
ncbi:type IV secretion system protein VirB10 [Ruegeria sp. EL01]|uniref:type IV secretion system protein VirB10 n=1 Tax=Ruegeria sp. EL01 TaxID=2107578 RepID=UPI000EA82280|nr:type IV secretion system protein VirB10 [Ruegeria sp. EL01]